MNEQAPRGAVLLLGMHRSGTSALTRGLEVLGIDLGSDLKPAVPGENDKGFFEDWTLSTINDELLALTNEQWDSLLATAPKSLSGDRVNELKLKALAYMERAFADAAYIAFKDPRSCRHVWFWDDVIARDGRAPFHLIAFRNPVSVAKSLEARNGFPSKKSLYIWLVHYLRAIQHSMDKPRAFVDFDDLLAAPEAVLEGIAAKIGHPEVQLSAAKLAFYQKTFLDRGLRRHAFRPETLDLDAGCSPIVADVYRLLRRESKESADFSGDWRGLIAAFNAVAPHLDLLQDIDKDRALAVSDKTRLHEALVAAQRASEQHDQELQQALGRVSILELEVDEQTASHAAAADEAARASRVDVEALLAAAADERRLELERQQAEAREAFHNAITRERAQYAELLAEALEVERRAAEEAQALALSEFEQRTQKATEDTHLSLKREHETALAHERENAREVLQHAILRERDQYAELMSEAIEAERAAAAEALEGERQRARLAAERAIADAVRAQREVVEKAAAQAIAENVCAQREMIQREAERAFEQALQADRIAIEEAAEQAIAEAVDAERGAASARAQFLAEAVRESQQRLDSATLALAKLEERAEQERNLKDAALQNEQARVTHLERQVEELEHQLHHINAERTHLVDAVSALRGSTSWRITEPLRAVRNLFVPSAGIAASEVSPLSVAPPTPPLTPSLAPPHAAPRARARSRVHFTICAKNYLPIARTCLESSAKHHPDAEHVLVLCDEIDQAYDPRCEPFRVVVAREIGIEKFADMAFRYDVMELSTAIKPFCIGYFFDQGVDEVVYLDPDLYFLSPLQAVRDAFDQGAEAVVTPHINAPIWDEKRPSDHDMLRVGVFNLGFLALRRSVASVEFARWWGERLRLGAVSDPDRGLFTDQKWCDLLPCFVPNTAILNRPGYNLAYWNLMHRPVRREGEVWMAGGEPICFVHFSGASFSDPKAFSKHQNRYDACGIGALRDLYDAYRDTVRGHGFEADSSYRYAYAFDGEGRSIAPILRQVYREDLAPTSQLEKPTYDRVLACANEPAPEVGRIGDVFVSRLLHRIWKARADLRAAFDLNTEQGQRDFIGWAISAIPREYGLGSGVYPLDDGKVGVNQASQSPPARDPVSEISKSVLAHAPSLRPLYRRLPASWRQRAKVALTRSAFAGKGARPRDAAPLPGAALIGYARGELGMGEHVRMTAAALHAESVPFGIVNISDDVLARQEDRRFDQFHSDGADFRVNIFHVNADQLPVVTARLGDHFLQRKRNIAYPFWELASFPSAWMPQLNAMDELWAPTKFIQDALLKSAERPVVHMPVAVELAPGYDKWRRSDFGLAPDAFLFLFYFDLASFSSRKNPVAVVESFKSALVGFHKHEHQRVGLVIKVISADRFPKEFGHLEEMTRSIPGVVLMPEVFAPDQIHGLVNCCDVFVSLHRSEGFGRGPAEAMRLGKVAVATAYSGNMDYMDESNSFPVPFRLRQVQADEYPFGSGQFWADPDVREAAAVMAKLVNEPWLSRELGERARQHMTRHHSQEVIGRRYGERLRSIGALS